MNKPATFLITKLYFILFLHDGYTMLDFLKLLKLQIEIIEIVQISYILAYQNFCLLSPLKIQKKIAPTGI